MTSPRAVARRLAFWAPALLLACGSASPKKAQLRTSWRDYVHDYVQSDGRVVDQTQGGITTSEGQAYAMLRALWLDDRGTFDRLRVWTQFNLQGGDPIALPAWRWGGRADGSWGVIDPQPASDADLLIVWSLLGAHRVWKDESYREQAVGLADRIWHDEVVEVGGRFVLLPGPWAKTMEPIWVNPSYVMPFVLRDLVIADSTHRWGRVLDDSYALLAEVTEKYALPPDWCFLDPVTGAVVDPQPAEVQRLDFGFEALRLPWVLAADLAWHGEPRAKRLLASLDPLATRFRDDGSIPAVLQPGGEPRVTWEARSLYGSLLPVWAVRHPELVDPLLERIDALAVTAPKGPQQGRDYYAANWVWFGQALWSGTARPLEAL